MCWNSIVSQLVELFEALLQFEADELFIISDLIRMAKYNLRFILTHNPHVVTKANKVST
jgi:hypothetical protein